MKLSASHTGRGAAEKQLQPQDTVPSKGVPAHHRSKATITRLQLSRLTHPPPSLTQITTPSLGAAPCLPPPRSGTLEPSTTTVRGTRCVYTLGPGPPPQRWHNPRATPPTNGRGDPGPTPFKLQRAHWRGANSGTVRQRKSRHRGPSCTSQERTQGAQTSDHGTQFFLPQRSPHAQATAWRILVPPGPRRAAHAPRHPSGGIPEEGGGGRRRRRKREDEEGGG